MSKKRKPRLGWEPSGFYSFPYLSKEDYQSIAETLHIAEMPEDVRSELQEAVREYLADKNHRANIPSKSEVRAALFELNKKVNDLEAHLEQLDGASSDALQSTKVFAAVDVDNSIVCLISRLHRIGSASLEVLSKLGQDKGGRPKHKVALRGFVSELRGIFEKATGSRATITWHEHRNEYGGLFFDFVHRCLEIADPDEIYSNSSIGQQIKQALKSARTIQG